MCITFNKSFNCSYVAILYVNEPVIVILLFLSMYILQAKCCTQQNTYYKD